MQVIATQDKNFRGFFQFKKKGRTINVLVFDDPELIEDPNYAPGVMDSLVEAWENGDYFLVESVNHKGVILDSVGSMAGYGGPAEAAAAAVRDHF